jgi:hypothetical protein
MTDSLSAVRSSRVAIVIAMSCLVVVLVVGAVRYLTLPSFFGSSDVTQSNSEPVVTQAPAPALVNIPETRNQTAPVERPGEKEQENQARDDSQAALSGTYSGTIYYPEAGFTGKAELAIEGARFTLTDSTTGRRLTGQMVATQKDGYIEIEVTFEPGDTAHEDSKSASMILANFESPGTQRLSLSLRATLSDRGWVIKNAPNEKHRVSFVQQGCPPYPYCRPVRTCRPCKPK